MDYKDPRPIPRTYRVYKSFPTDIYLAVDLNFTYVAQMAGRDDRMLIPTLFMRLGIETDSHKNWPFKAVVNIPIPNIYCFTLEYTVFSFPNLNEVDFAQLDSVLANFARENVALATKRKRIKQYAREDCGEYLSLP